MTELSPAMQLPEKDPSTRTKSPTGGPAVRSYLGQIVGYTFTKFGAKLGGLWILLMVLLAAFAPFLANTHPLLVKQNGQWSTPFFRFLTPMDVILQLVFWVIIGLWLTRRWSTERRLIVWGGLLLAGSFAAAIFVRPPEPVVYDVYRVANERGQIEQAYYTPIRFSPKDNLRDQPMKLVRLAEPSGQHPMGTTSEAGDLAANMIYASRIALSIGLVATSVAVTLGVIMGGVMGYFGGWVDLIGMRIVEIFQSIPAMLLLLAFAGLFQDAGASSLFIMMGIIGFLTSFSYAEFVRAEYLTLRDRDFVHAARASGLPLPSILFRHILPNGLTPLIVNASFGVASAILAESTLSFLNIGLKDEASWGNLLNQAQGPDGSFYWWLALFPGGAIFLTVFSYNLIGEALRDAMDPKIVRTV